MAFDGLWYFAPAASLLNWVSFRLATTDVLLPVLPVLGMPEAMGGEAEEGEEGEKVVGGGGMREGR